MGFFVKARGRSGAVPEADLVYSLLATGKRLGMSFREINELRVADLFGIAWAFMGKEDDSPRQATQADIDRLLA